MHLVDDAARHQLEELVRQAGPAGGHEVDRLHAAQCDHIVVAPAIAHDGDGTHRQEHGECLARAIVEIVTAQLLDVDRIRLA